MNGEILSSIFTFLWNKKKMTPLNFSRLNTGFQSKKCENFNNVCECDRQVVLCGEMPFHKFYKYVILPWDELAVHVYVTPKYQRSTSHNVYNYMVSSQYVFVHVSRHQRLVIYGPHREKTCLPGFRQSEFQTSLLSFRD